MRFLIFNLSLLSVVVSSYSSSWSDRNIEPVCGSFHGYTKTFKSRLEFNDVFISSGKGWSFLYPGACAAVSECKTFNPVCGVSNTNNYRTFLNICLMKAEQKLSGTVWKYLSNGICSEQPSLVDNSISSFPEESQTALPKYQKYYKSRISYGSHAALPEKNHKSRSASGSPLAEAVRKYIKTIAQALKVSASQDANSVLVNVKRKANNAALNEPVARPPALPESAAPTYTLLQQGQSLNPSLYLISQNPNDKYQKASQLTYPKSQMPSTPPVKKPRFSLAQLANTFLLLGKKRPYASSLLTNVTATGPTKTAETIAPSASYQKIYNNAVIQGPFSYAPKRYRINFGDINLYALKRMDSVYTGGQGSGSASIQGMKETLKSLETNQALNEINGFIGN